ERLLLDTLAKVVHVEDARTIAATLDFRSRVRVRGMKIIRRDRNPEFAAITQKLTVGVDLLVAPRLSELDLHGPVGIMHARQDLDVKLGKPVLGGLQVFEWRGLFTELQARVPQSDLFQKQQILIRDLT